MEAGRRELGVGALLHWNSLLITGGLFVTLAGLNSMSGKVDAKHLSISVLLLILAIGLLITSADFFIEGAKGLARRAGIAEVIIGLTIVSIGTSLPEILVTSTAAFESSSNPGMMDLAIGNIYGSVLVQITLVLGLVVVFKPLNVRPAWLKRDGLLMLGATALLSLLLWLGDGLSRVDGVILCSIYIGYIVYLLRNRERIREEEIDVVDEIRSSEFDWTNAAYLVMVVIGLTLAVYAAHHLVILAADLALRMDVPPAVVGTTVSGLGTSLPELTVALMAARRSNGVAIGTLIGSNITDPLLSIGIAAIVAPLHLTDASYDLTMYLIVPMTILGVGMCIAMMWTGFRFNRWEGGVLIGFYLLFLALLELHRQGYISL